MTNSAPTANGVSESVVHVQALSAFLNETDGDGDTLEYSVAADPVDGTLVLKSDGSYDYTPITGFAGTDSFDYFVTDGAETVTA